MKKCPFCKAELEENARFCLYCMAQLDEKTVVTAKNRIKRTRLIIIGAALCLLIAAVLLICFACGDKGIENADAGTQAESSYTDEILSDASESSEDISYVSDKSSDVSDESTQASEDESIHQESSDGATVDVSTDAGTENSTSSSFDESKPSEQSEDDVSDAESVIDTSLDTNINESVDESGGNIPQSTNTVVYKYRDATTDDEPYGSYGLTENAVTIIGVETASENGVYVIPDVIDGKKVFAVAEYAFSETHVCEGVRIVVIPETVKNIYNNAFAFCYNMTDIYLCGEAVAGSPLYFLPMLEKRNHTITLHASATCHDRNLHTYKSIYSYEEWTGKSIGIFDEWNGWE